MDSDKLGKILSLIAPNLESASSENFESIKNIWIENRYMFNTKERFFNFIQLSVKLPFFGMSLFYGELYRIKE
jgi:hypothetical protein